MPPPMPPLKRRNPVAKFMRGLHGGPHRSGPSRADLKRELKRRLTEADPPTRRFDPRD